MDDPTDLLERLGREHAALDAVLRLRWFHWVAVLLSLVLTVLAWRVASDVSRHKEQRRFEHEAGLVADAVAWRIERSDAVDAAGLVRLMHGALDPERRLVGVSVTRGAEAVYDDGLLARRHGARDAVRVPLGHDDGTWALELWSTPRLERRARRYLPDAVLAGGLGIEALLLGLFVAQSRGARRTLELAATSGSLSAELAATDAELRRVNAELERFACTASHDLRAPLQGILMQLELVELDLDEGGVDEASLRARIGRMQEQVRRLERLIDGVLAYSTAEAGAGETADVDVRALVREIGEALNVRSERLVVETDAPALRTDAVRLSQVLSNLVGNAFRYHDAPERATVRVRCEAGPAPTRADGAVAPSMLAFSVDDDGPGIAETDRERVFDIFTRLPSARADGTGVGLSIVRRSVEALGGRVTVGASPSGGARFSFTWPATVLPEAIGTDAATPRPGATHATPAHAAPAAVPRAA